MDRNRIIDKIQAKLKELDTQIDQLQVRADKASETVRHQWETRRIELQAMRKKLNHQLDEAGNAADKGLDELQANVEKTWGKATQSLKEIRDKLLG